MGSSPAGERGRERERDGREAVGSSPAGDGKREEGRVCGYLVRNRKYRRGRGDYRFEGVGWPPRQVRSKWEKGLTCVCVCVWVQVM